MTPLGKLIRTSPIHARFVPFAVLVGLIFFQESFGEGAGRYWMYLVRMAISGWCIWEMRSMVPEIRWAFSWEAVVAGILVCAMWIGIDPYYPKIEFLFKASEPWNPFKQFGNGTAMAWFFVAVRTLGSTFRKHALQPVALAFPDGDFHAVWPGALSMALGLSLRSCFSGISAAQESPRRCHYCPRADEFPAVRLDRLEKRLEILVNLSACYHASYSKTSTCWW
jgi:hypothetical protein